MTHTTMRPEELPAELVTKIETAVSQLPGWVLGEPNTAALHVVAAVMPEIQARALIWAQRMAMQGETGIAERIGQEIDRLNATSESPNT